MATRHGKTATIYADTLDLSGYANAWTLTIDRDVTETTVFSDAAKTFLGGDYTWKIDWTSFYDTTDDGYSEVVGYDWAVTNSGTVRQVALLPGGSTAGNEVYEAQGLFTAKPIEVSTTAAIMLNCSLQGTGNLGRGMVLYSGSIAATGAQASVDFGAVGIIPSGTTSAVVYRILTITSGAGSIVVATEESSDDAVGDPFAAVAAYASGTLSGTAVSYVRSASTGAIERYRKINCTTKGPTSFTCLVNNVRQIL